MHKLLDKEAYRDIQKANIDSNGKLATILIRDDNPHWNYTQCPECRMENFTHVEGCSLIPAKQQNETS